MIWLVSPWWLLASGWIGGVIGFALACLLVAGGRADAHIDAVAAAAAAGLLQEIPRPPDGPPAA